MYDSTGFPVQPQQAPNILQVAPGGGNFIKPMACPRPTGVRMVALNPQAFMPSIQQPEGQPVRAVVLTPEMLLQLQNGGGLNAIMPNTISMPMLGAQFGQQVNSINPMQQALPAPGVLRQPIPTIPGSQSSFIAAPKPGDPGRWSRLEKDR